MRSSPETFLSHYQNIKQLLVYNTPLCKKKRLKKMEKKIRQVVNVQALDLYLPSVITTTI